MKISFPFIIQEATMWAFEVIWVLYYYLQFGNRMSIKQSVLQQLKQGGHVSLALQYIGDQGMHKLCALAESQDISILMLTFNQIGPGGFLRFPKQAWKNLRSLFINCNLIGDRGCKYLSQAHLSLQVLIASENHIGNAGALHLSKAQWAEILKLDLKTNMLSGEGFGALLRVNWGKVRAIYVDYHRFTKGQLLPLFLSEITSFVTFNIRKKQGSTNLIVKMKRKLTQKLGQIELDYR